MAVCHSDNLAVPMVDIHYFKKINDGGEDLGPITLPKRYLEHSTWLSVPSGFDELRTWAALKLCAPQLLAVPANKEQHKNWGCGGIHTQEFHPR